ncbi:CocE/NonD family hydrolase C-terminal non-catalytic domain-containing protein [Kitasatospora sp. NPDC101183]|uniref:CocE/NonD family hydrolase C-terminal non-catalytic domain-containing protein n=1 Tax=Kitasatospora sp. NPDC101183 TaxID=3364100 RepID=UPI00382C7D5C
MEQLRVAAVTGPRGPGSGYAVGGRLVLASAHVSGPAGTRVKVFHPGGTGSADGTVVWAGSPGGRDDAALVLVDDSSRWRPPTAPVVWGRPDTKRPGTECETWGVPDEAQRKARSVEAAQLRGEVNPGSGFVGNQYVMDVRTSGAGWPGDGTSPWGGLSGAAVFCDRYLTGVVASDRANSGHGRLNVVPSYVLHHDPDFRTALAEHGGGPAGGLVAVEFQDVADPIDSPAAIRRSPVTPAALLEAGRQVVPFHGRAALLAELEAWRDQGGFGAWLLHGPGGQGKTCLAHRLGRELSALGWTVLWPRADARPDQLLEVRRAAKPLLVVLDYAETRPEQFGALVDAAAEHAGTSPFKLLLLARTAGDWWQQARAGSRQAEELLATARTRRLPPLEDDPDRRADHYHDAARALAEVLPTVPGLNGHNWTAAATTLTPPRQLPRDAAYGNALTLHMTALADLLDTAQAAPASSGNEDEDVQDVEDRLLRHEDRYWQGTATTHGLTPVLGMNTLRTALTGAAENADLLWRRLPALADQPRDRRDQVTAWLAPSPTSASATTRPWPRTSSPPAPAPTTPPPSSPPSTPSPPTPTLPSTPSTRSTVCSPWPANASPPPRSASPAPRWLRVSHRELDGTRSQPYRPVHPHDTRSPLQAGAVVEAAVEILPTSRVFAAGHRLGLVIQAADRGDPTRFRHDDPADRTHSTGTNTVHTGGRHPSYLLVPVIPPKDS